MALKTDQNVIWMEIILAKVDLYENYGEWICF